MLYLRQHIDVFMKPSPQDDPDWSPPDQSQTLEGQFYFVARNSDDDVAPLLRLLHALFQTDYWLYFRAIQAVREELAAGDGGVGAALAHGAPGGSRLSELGLGDADLRLPATGEARRASEGAARARPRELRTTGLDVRPARARPEERALFRAIRELAPHERGGVFHALISLSNRIAVADRMELGDPESLPRALDKATRYASDGLDSQPLTFGSADSGVRAHRMSTRLRPVQIRRSRAA